MTRWTQIGGDMSWERHGAVLALDEPTHRQVHLLRIDPWIEHEREAAVSHGLYLVDEKTLDYDDLGDESKDLRGALSYVGMELDEYEKLPPVHRAEILASYSGYDESRSVDRLAEALPAAAGEIEFWAGKESPEKLDAYDREMRLEALQANFDTHLTAGEMPPDEALAFALAGQPFEMDLKGQDAMAFEYAMAVAEASGSTDTNEEFATTVRALAAAPEPGELGRAKLDEVTRVLEEWERRHGDPADEDDGIAAAARSLASSMMESIGFVWT